MRIKFRVRRDKGRIVEIDIFDVDEPEEGWTTWGHGDLKTGARLIRNVTKNGEVIGPVADLIAILKIAGIK